MHNLGRYENFIGNQEIGKQQIIFGFNGSGKSTLSDMFYSLANKKSISLDRRTLDKISGEKAGEISVILGTESEDIVYSESDNWNRELEIYTFNEQYIRDYVFVNREYKQDIALVTMGAEGVKFANEKAGYLQQINEHMLKINIFLSANKEICSELGLGKNKVKEDNSKRLDAIKNLKLFPLSSKAQIEEELKKTVETSKEVQQLLECIEKIKSISIRDTYVSIADLKKILGAMPVVKNSEINDHMKKCLKKDNVKWLVSGFYNQKDAQICPYCGQTIESREAKRFLKELQKFIASKMQIKAKEIIEDAKQEIQLFDEEKIALGITEYQNILNIIESEAIFPVTTQKKLAVDFVWNNSAVVNLRQIVNKLWSKVENPYQVISLNPEEINCISALNKISKRIGILEKELQTRYNKIVEKIKQEKQIKLREALFEASYGENRDGFIEISKSAEQVLKLNEKVIETSRKLDDCFDRIKLKKINEVLRELNIKFTLDVEGRQYYIKLKDYVPQKYDKEKSKICSEGEKRILAFAYFLSEIEEKQNSKIIVIDDPITSLDLSRKSVIAYRIGELFRDNNDQVIVMTHDIAFVEQILEFSGTMKENVSMMELKNRENIFYPLEIKDYLMSDEMVYKSFITNAMVSNNESDRIIGLMSLRPYTSIVNPAEYSTIEKESTYFAHTVYAHNAKRNIKYDENMYNCEGLRKYIHDVEVATELKVDCSSFVPDGYCFQGFEYENVKNMYLSISLETIVDARKKAMLLRVALEACLFQLTTKAKFDPERIGNEYKKVIGSCSGDKKKIAKKLKELYDLSKKYHHGADEGSTLGLSWINPDELELFDSELKEIFDWIDENCVIKMVAA